MAPTTIPTGKDLLNGTLQRTEPAGNLILKGRLRSFRLYFKPDRYFTQFSAIGQYYGILI
jgi:hypothetical protein